MRMRIAQCCVVLLMTIFCVTGAAAGAAPDGGTPIREIPVPGLAGGGLSAYDRWGPVIYLNPQLMALGGGVFAFLRLHEYGHHRLGHVTPSMAFMSSWPRTLNEPAS